jgi:hypothetical protein
MSAMGKTNSRKYPQNSLKTDRGDTYSTKIAFIYAILGIAMLWWIPVIGPFFAGFISGRKAGSAKDALSVSLIMTALVIFTSLYLISTAVQQASLVGYYLKDGIFAFATKPLAATSQLAVDTQSFYGILTTMTLIVPSSLIIFNATSLLGGSISTTIREENRGMFNPSPFIAPVSQPAASRGTRIMPNTPIYDDEAELESYNDSYQPRMDRL